MAALALLVHISFIFAAAAWTGWRRVSHTKSDELQTDSSAAQEARLCFGLHRQISQGIDSTVTRLQQCVAGY